MEVRDKVYQAGKTAFDENKDRDRDNPFSSRHPLYLSWDWGWTDRREEVNTTQLLNEQKLAVRAKTTRKGETYSGKLF